MYSLVVEVVNRGRVESIFHYPEPGQDHGVDSSQCNHGEQETNEEDPDKVRGPHRFLQQQEQRREHLESRAGDHGQGQLVIKERPVLLSQLIVISACNVIGNKDTNIEQKQNTYYCQNVVDKNHVVENTYYCQNVTVRFWCKL